MIQKKHTSAILKLRSPPKVKKRKTASPPIHHDITEQEKTTNKLIENERRFRRVFNSLSQFTQILSPEGILLEVNKTALDFIHAKQIDVIGRPLWDTPWWSFSKNAQKQLKAAIKQARQDKFVQFEATNKPYKGNFKTIDFSLSPIKEGAGKIVLLVVEGHDITDRKKLEQQKNTFLSIASHELKTPITTLQLMLEVFLRRFAKQGIKTNELQIINRELTRLSSLTNELLDISRIDSGKLILQTEKIDLTLLTKQIIEKMKLLAEKRKIFFFKSPQYIVCVDVNRIGEVFTNLIINSIKYSDDKTTIRIQIKKKKNFVVVSVQDEGMGIPKAKLPFLFSKFYQVNEQAKGFGLGLYISRKIIEKHKGKIWVRSTEGKGSTFYFSLPLPNS